MLTRETDEKFTRPGVTLLATGALALLLRLILRNVPVVGGLLGVVMLLGGIFFLVGGAFLLVKKKA